VTVVWLIGSAPTEAGAIPLRADGGKTSTGDRLREMLGMSLDEYEAAFARANVLAEPPWRPRAAAVAGRRLRKTITESAVVLGRDPWLALGLPSSTRYFETVENFTLVPHPSGKNLAYNDASIRVKLKDTIDALRRSR
jgi:hypothetical protein